MIVGEVSTTWSGGGTSSGTGNYVASKFEMMIRVNAERGYRLHSWKYDSVAVGRQINETIVAVFEKEPDDECD